ncbi:quinone oxidoreductase family protein [Amycolatopsis thermoflava]|uniref:quinone oxidoreductase family protein n=1 Tax=Amycolatopsis thermoflava TaxID=84480 RepID=UPI003D7165FD
MKAIILPEFGAPDVLRFGEAPDPELGPGEVRVHVQAAIVSRTKDVGARAGRPPFAPRMTLPHVLGAEHAGTVDAVGEGVDPALLGRSVAVSAVLSCNDCRACAIGREEACSSFRLIGVDRPGSYAQYTVVPAANVHPTPSGMAPEMAAALAANGPVARAQLDAGGVGRDSVVLIPGGAGSLGSAAAALAAWRGAHVIAIERLPQKAPALAALPLFASFDSERDDLAAAILDRTDGWGVDCVVDNLGYAPLWNRYRPALADMGRIVVSGALGTEPIPMQLSPFYLRSQSLIGVRTGNRAQMRALWEDVRAGFELPASLITPVDWTDVVDAHQTVENGTARGQLVLRIA